MKIAKGAIHIYDTQREYRDAQWQYDLCKRLGSRLEMIFAPRAQMHAGLVEIFGMGVALLDPFTVSSGGGFVTRPFTPAVNMDLTTIHSPHRPLSSVGQAFLSELI